MNLTALRISVGIICVAATLAGCMSTPPSSPLVGTTMPATTMAATDPSTQPSNVMVSGETFDQLWNASDAVARDLLFQPDRLDRRTGTFQTLPMTSAQWFEPWRREVRTEHALLESSLASIRRTLTVRITHDDATGLYHAMPSVLVERFARVENRVTSSARYRQLYDSSGSTGLPGPVLLDRNDPIAMEAAAAQLAYWYPLGNDPDLERYVAAKIAQRIQH